MVNSYSIDFFTTVVPLEISLISIILKENYCLQNSYNREMILNNLLLNGILICFIDVIYIIDILSKPFEDPRRIFLLIHTWKRLKSLDLAQKII